MAFRGEVRPDDWIRLDDQPKLHLASTIKDLRFPPDLDGGGSKVPARTDDREVPNPMLPEDRGEALDVGGDETVVDPEDARPEVLDAEARIALFEDERSPRNSVVETMPPPPTPPPPAAKTTPPGRRSQHGTPTSIAASQAADDESHRTADQGPAETSSPASQAMASPRRRKSPASDLPPPPTLDLPPLPDFDDL